MIFRYPGGKSKKNIKKIILENAPEKFDEYREPFVGGGGIYFEVSDKYNSITKWINDINIGLMSVYKELKENSEYFIKYCRNIEPHSDIETLMPPIYNKRLKEKFDSIKLDENAYQAFRYLFVNRTVWAGRVNYKIPSRLYFSNPTGWNLIHKIGILEKSADLLKNTKITCGDYSNLLEYEGENVWIYLDPPYLVNTNLNKQSQLYADNFTMKDHIELSEKVKKCKHKILLSYDNNNEIKKLYNGLNIIEVSWKYCGSSLSNKKDGNEILIKNY